MKHTLPSIAVFAIASVAMAAPVKPALDRQFEQTVRPFLAKHCNGCHSGATPAAQFDLTAYQTLDQISKDYPRWALVMERLEAKDMPPKPMAPPPAAATHDVIGWIQAVRAGEIKKTAGDPGPVPARRLSNAEYNYTVRDLTGQDLNVTREFPIDPANQAGFDNSGESLTMSSALLNKYLQAAREVTNNMVLTPDAIDFSPHPMLVETDREKFAVQRIVKFYLNQPTHYSAYFQAAWRFKHRVALGSPAATLASLAAEAKISPKYLPLVWQILNEPKALGPVAKLQKMWLALPVPAAKQVPETLQAKTLEMQEFVTTLRAHTAKEFSAPLVKGLPAGSQPLLNWKLREYSLHRREFEPKTLRNDTDPPPVIPAIPRFAGLHQEAAPRWAAVSAKARAEDKDLIVPAAQRKEYEAAFARFAQVFPDRFYITERGRFWPDETTDKGRLLSAGYHSVIGFYRDDLPLQQLILDEKAKKEIDRLWNEFDYMAQATDRTWTQYFFNQSGEVQGKGAESASDRPIGHALKSTHVIQEMRDRYLAKAAAAPTNDPIAPTAIRDHYDHIDATLRDLERQKKLAEPKHLEALLRFAARAYRRPLTKVEKDSLLAHYRVLRTKNELSHDDSIRESLVSVLMAPDFLYRFDMPNPLSSGRAPAPRRTGSVLTQPLSNLDLASRLSYFLWSSAPDAELLQHAAAGDLNRPAVLLAQTRRLLKDARVRGMATEFTGNWLGFRHFEKSNSVDRQRFPTFNNDLRQAMFTEPVRLVENTLLQNGSVLDLLYAKYTFVNPPLAKHYGMPEVKGDVNTWVRVEDADQYGRGGLLPMAVFLTQNSPGLRTSPVKRGNWVVQRVLGEIVPPPPPVVPELPHDEATSELPVRDMLAKHRDNPACAACHARIDSFGLPFEGYSPVGNARSKDLAGRPVDTLVTYPGGSTGTGVPGLLTFIREHRQKDFVANISRKMLAFALNRSLQLSDESLVDRMTAQAAANEFRINSLVETIVTSPQFLNKRAPEARQVTQTPSPVRMAK